MQKPFYARWNIQILAIVLFLLPFAIVGAITAKNSNKNQVKDWLPPELPANRDYAEFRQRFQGDEFVLLSWEGCTLDDQRLKMMALKLDPASGDPEVTRYFKEVLTGPRAIQQYVDSRSKKDENALVAEPVPLESTHLGPWRLSLDSETRSDQEDAISRLTGYLIGAPQTAEARQDPNKLVTALVLKLSETGRGDMRTTIGLLKDIALESGIPEADLHMGGPPVDNVAIDNAGEDRLLTLFGISILIGVMVSWYSLRNLKLVALVVMTGVYSMCLSLALIAITGQSVNAIVLTMPTLVYVATTSGAIHFCNYYRDTIRAGTPAWLAPTDAIKHAWLPLSLATGTTAVGLMSLCYSNLVPIRMFGIFSAIGVVLSLLLLFLFIPSVLQTWPTRREGGDSEDEIAETVDHHRPENSFWWGVGEWIARRHVISTVFCLVILFGVGAGMMFSTTSVQLMKLFPSGARILNDYQWLEDNLGPLVPMEIIVAIDKRSDLVQPELDELNFLERIELVDVLQGEIESIDEVGATMSAATFVPLHQGDRRGAYGINPRDVMNRRLLDDKNMDQLLAGDYLRQEQDDQTGATTQFFRITARISAMKDVDYAEFRQTLSDKVDPVLAEYAEDGVKGVSVSYTGVMPLIYDAQNRLLDDLIYGFFADFALIIIAMMLVCRDWSAGPVLLIPSAFPVIVVFGMLGWAGIPVDIGTVMAPAVALGVTVDDVVHFMLWFQRGINRGLDRVQSVMLAYKACARPMYQSWGVIGLGLAVYAFSPFVPTQKFGYLMVSMLTVALIGNLVFLPAVLAGPLGGIFAWGIRRRAERTRLRAERNAARKTTTQPIAQPNPSKNGERIPEPHMLAESKHSFESRSPGVN